MSPSNFLSVPVLESRAASNSSSSSSSTFGSDPQTSDSQTDYSPPHSPKKEVLQFTRPLVQSVLDHAALLDRLSATPRQSPRVLDRDWAGEIEDLGYDSEHENPPNTTMNRPRFLHRKKISSCHHTIGRLDSSRGGGPDLPLPDTNIGANNPLQSTSLVQSHLIPSPSTKTLLPQESSPQSPPQKPRLRPTNMLDDMSPLEPLPPLEISINLKENFRSAPLPGPMSVDNLKYTDTTAGGTDHRLDLFDAQTPRQESLPACASGREHATIGNRSTLGLGLGLPSGFTTRFGVQKASHRRVATPIKVTKENSQSKENLHTGDYHYPRRRLYSICETSSPLGDIRPRKLYSISYPGAVMAVAQIVRRTIPLNSRCSSLLLTSGRSCESVAALFDVPFQNSKRDLPSRRGLLSCSPSTLDQPYMARKQPRSTYDTVAPWAVAAINEGSRQHPPYAVNFFSMSLVGNMDISPVLTHIKTSKKPHFANHRHYRTEHTLF